MVPAPLTDGKVQMVNIGGQAPQAGPPSDDNRSWGMPTIWGILAVILVVGCAACCGILHHMGIG